MRRSSVILSFLLVALALIGIGGGRPVCTSVHAAASPRPTAPDNYLHINDESYRLYQKGLNNDILALLYADSLEQFAGKVNDTRGLVLAEFMRAHYWEHQGDLDLWYSHLMNMRRMAKEYDDDRDYYYSYYNEAAHYFNVENDLDHALAVVKEMTHEARVTDNKFGQWDSYTTLAEFYYRKREPKYAIEYSHKALEVQPEVFPYVSPTSNYLMLARLYEERSKKEEYTRKALAASVTWDDSLRAYSEMSAAYKANNDTLGYLKLYDEIMVSSNKERFGKATLINMELSHLLYLKLYPNALNHLEQNRRIYPDADYYYNLSAIYAHLGKYKLAYLNRIKYDSIYSHANFAKTYVDMHQTGLDITNFRLQRKAAQQELIQQQEQNELRKAEMMRSEAMMRMTTAQNRQEQARAISGRDSANTRRLQLESQQRALAAEEAQEALKEAELDRQLEEKHRQTDALRSRGMLIGSIALLMLIIFAIIASIARSRRRQHKRMIKLNNQLEKAIKDLNNASHKKDLFLQNMSHELRTPLNAVMGLSQILTSGVPVSEDEKIEYGHDINNNTRMLQMLIDDILNVSAIEKGTYTMNLQMSDISVICRDAMGIAQCRLPYGVELRYDNELPPAYSCVIDSKRAQQVLVNYLTNACKHTTQGHIIVRSTINDNPGYLTLSVTDTGTGIPADQADNIFERFTKLDDFVQGTGLGLNICHTIAQMLNGRVWLDTTYTDGARFCFEVPTNLTAST
ncbi:MAG: HAMP domain-containing histidine kinase [Bacteroidaceae bacterium]|nr:HAMP domain-containing histidine kinase [Bacteroidaceae bacterium]MBR4782960.1 HAMP domain-containing histidine kinase [Bacteroidaceae bacterium]